MPERQVLRVLESLALIGDEAAHHLSGLGANPSASLCFLLVIC